MKRLPGVFFWGVHTNFRLKETSTDSYQLLPLYFRRYGKCHLPFITNCSDFYMCSVILWQPIPWLLYKVRSAAVFIYYVNYMIQTVLCVQLGRNATNCAFLMSWNYKNASMIFMKYQYIQKQWIETYNLVFSCWFCIQRVFHHNLHFTGPYGIRSTLNQHECCSFSPILAVTVLIATVNTFF